MADLNTSNNKASSLLYLREDRIKISLTNFFEANRIFEKEIFNNLDDEQLGMADIRCLLIINLNPGIIFNELLNILDIRKQSLNRVLRSLLKEKFIIQKINSNDGRKKNLYLTDTAKDKLNNVIKPLIDRLSKSYVKSGANAVQGFNMVVNSLIEINNEKQSTALTYC